MMVILTGMTPFLYVNDELIPFDKIHIVPENHQFLVETNLPTSSRVYVNLLEAKTSK
jgi:hypothetical protein